jgi:cytochrome c-type biogenesis protein CcmH/NrfG
MISKVANWVMGAILLLIIVFLVYHYTSWFKPAADHAVNQVKSVIGLSLPDGPFGKGASEAQLNQARDAYAKGDMEGSVAAYKEYIKKNPSNADANGELGNVYFSAGKMPEAAQAYFDAAKLLIEQKQPERVDELMPIIAQVNPAMANELSAKLSQAGGQEQQPPAGIMQAAQGQPSQVAPQEAAPHLN